MTGGHLLGPVRPLWPRWRGLACALVAAFVIVGGHEPGEAASPPSRIPCGTCEEANRFVRLQVPPAEPPPQKSGGYDHPLQLGPEDWVLLLRRIHVQSRQEDFLFGSRVGPVLEAFSPDEIEFLGRNLSKAFGEAHPDETIVFGFARERAPELIEITTGSWFLKDDSLYLLLANYRTAVTLPGIRRMLWEEPLRIQPGLSYDLVPGDHQTLVQSTAGRGTPFGSPQPSQIAIQYRFIVQSADHAGSTSVDPTPAADQLEQQLQRLKRLREQGLITEEDFNAKKKALLDRL